MLTLARKQRKTALKSYRFSSTFASVDFREKQRFCVCLENEPVLYDQAELGSIRQILNTNSLPYCTTSLLKFTSYDSVIISYLSVKHWLMLLKRGVTLDVGGFIFPTSTTFFFYHLASLLFGWEQLNAATTHCRTLWTAELLTS